MAILKRIKKENKETEKKTEKKKDKKKVEAKASEFAYSVVLAPYITEKASLMTAENKYVFKVSEKANKIMIKNAIESLYDVKVLSVNVINMPKKKVRIGLHEGKKPGFKKAIVKLKEGDKIDLGV